MTMRFDRVVRKGYEDDRLVYSLVLDEHGLYIIHTGDVGGLVNDQGDVNMSSDDASTPDFVRQVAEQEARIDNEPLPVLVHALHSAYVPLQQVTDVQADSDSEFQSLTLQTVSERFDFVFTHDNGEQISALVEALKVRSDS